MVTQAHLVFNLSPGYHYCGQLKHLLDTLVFGAVDTFVLNI